LRFKELIILWKRSVRLDSFEVVGKKVVFIAISQIYALYQGTLEL